MIKPANSGRRRIGVYVAAGIFLATSVGFLGLVSLKGNWLRSIPQKILEGYQGPQIQTEELGFGPPEILGPSREPLLFAGSAIGWRRYVAQDQTGELLMGTEFEHLQGKADQYPDFRCTLTYRVGSGLWPEPQRRIEVRDETGFAFFHLLAPEFRLNAWSNQGDKSKLEALVKEIVLRQGWTLDNDEISSPTTVIRVQSGADV